MDQPNADRNSISRAVVRVVKRAARFRRLGRTWAGLGLGLAATTLGAWRSLAQSLPNQELRLTVRPGTMATGTRTERAGVVQLDSNVTVYVPRQCVGSRRCPLLFWSNMPSQTFVRIADQYGLITSGSLCVPGGADMGDAFQDSTGTSQGHERVKACAARADSVLKTILRSLAIAPDKIAIVGGSATGWATSEYGDENLDVFSRTLVFTAHWGQLERKATAPANEFYISTAITENMGLKALPHIQRLRDLGYPVKFTIQFRDHGTEGDEDADFMGHWLLESWTIPDPSRRPAPYAFGEPLRLTPELMKKMLAFWTRFQQEPDSIRTTARRAHIREVTIPVGTEQMTTLMADMSALASTYPSVAAAFQAVGLTPAQYDACRAALASTRVAWIASHEIVGGLPLIGGGTPRKIGLPSYVSPASMVAQNLAFMETHSDEFGELSVTHMKLAPGWWQTP